MAGRGPCEYQGLEENREVILLSKSGMGEGMCHVWFTRSDATIPPGKLRKKLTHQGPWDASVALGALQSRVVEHDLYR